MRELVTRENITAICNECNIQPNHLFACFRKTLGVSQAKLAYILDTEGINQNTISRYEHKYIVTADVEYILWKWLLNEINKTFKKSKSGMSRFLALYIGGFQLYILRYANNKQAYMLQGAMTVREVAALLEVNNETVRRWIRTGKIKAEKDSNKEGNYICYNAFMDFLDENPKYSAIYYAKKEIYTSNLPIVIDVHVKNIPNDVEVIVNLIRD